MRSPAQRSVDKIFTIGGLLSAGVRDEILSHGSAIEALLLEVAGDDRLYDSSARGRGWAPLHAIELLGRLRSAAAIPLLLAQLDGDDFDLAFDRAHYALVSIGGAALEPCLAAHASASEELAFSLIGVLAELGVRDERVFQILVAALPENLGFGATNLAQYGDPRAVPILQAALARLAVGGSGDLLYDREIIDVCDSITELGVELSVSEQRKLDLTLARPRAEHDDKHAAAPGRNDACHCGSGRKYKRCHLRVTESAFRR